MTSSDLRPDRLARIPAADARRLAWARDAVARMTREERIAQLHQYAPGVERLGIGPFVTGTEGVHGVAWKGKATQFPQPVGMAASWDPELLEQAGATVALEVREMHAEDPAVSLSVWAPVVNLLRHPLWGRTEEAYTEDPLLNAVLACGFSSGLRGRGETWQTLPTLKHFLAYSNETDRAATSSEMPDRVLHEIELPGFVEPVARGLAASVMLSYNLVDGRPAHLTDLLETQLRAHLPDPDLLFVVSDAGAPGNLFRSQKVTADAAAAYAAMLRAGVDSFTDNDTDPRESVEAITAALEQGLIEDAHVERALVRQLLARARTGEFDDRIEPGSPADASSAGSAEAGSAAPSPAVPSRAARRELSREVAVRSAVLLSRRDESALPLPAGPLAVLGEQAHSVLRDWYSGEFCEVTSIAQALSARHDGPVRTARGLDLVSLHVRSTGAHPGVPALDLAPEDAAVRLAADSSLRLRNPGADGPAAAAAPARFAVIDLGEDVVALREVTTGLLLAPDDRGRLAARGERIGGWIAQETLRRVVGPDGSWQLQHVGTGRFLGVEHHTGALVLRTAAPASGAVLAVQVHRTAAEEVDAALGTGTAQAARAVVLVLGNDPHVHGRETEDRPHVRLPAPDRAAAERLAALPPEIATVLVITSSYPYDLEGLEERVGAVVWSSHAGEAEGEAIADLLTGARDFSGRLAQAWPDSSPLPPLLDYDVIRAGSTYQYGQSARFPFGHGLAVDAVRWHDARIDAGEDGLTVSVDLSAPAERATAGPLREVVQVYVDAPASAFSRREHAVPATRLVGFTALEVPADGSVTAQVSVPYARLALWASDRDAWELPDGPVRVRVARSSSVAEAEAEVSVPAAVLAAHALPAEAASADELRIPAHRAERTCGAVRAAASLLEGTEIRPLGAAPGTAAFVLAAGTRIDGLEVRALDGETPAGRAELVDPDAPDPASAPALPLPHRVPADGTRPTGRVLVRLSGPLALTALRCAAPPAAQA
ncbi:glycoside hydrolase family 3 protein [Brachybacterium phenoliresistens]|uniref:Beta-glucosidase n=1 Tax=Brachybacterium phenoliresistens TaxID=396014 RepID=Z9JNX3_9MICO|nr:glycoside hydrolase family 3 protein [Brachybacterium phenoliresistens]EWS80095.1 beta-glucosidase [Brachybacterium phenoliresistens]